MLTLIDGEPLKARLLLRGSTVLWKIAPKASNMPSQDVWKFTPVSYRTSALWGRCPKRRNHDLNTNIYSKGNERKGTGKWVQNWVLEGWLSPGMDDGGGGWGRGSNQRMRRRMRMRTGIEPRKEEEDEDRAGGGGRGRMEEDGGEGGGWRRRIILWSLLWSS